MTDIVTDDERAQITRAAIDAIQREVSKIETCPHCIKGREVQYDGSLGEPCEKCGGTGKRKIG